MSAFREGFVEADGFRIRYVDAGQGPALVHLHGAGGLRLTPAHDLFAKQFRVIAFEMPGFGASPENTKTQSMPELAATMAAACGKLGLLLAPVLGFAVTVHAEPANHGRQGQALTDQRNDYDAEGGEQNHVAMRKRRTAFDGERNGKRCRKRHHTPHAGKSQDERVLPRR